jgi:hypothetical protein
MAPECLPVKMKVAEKYLNAQSISKDTFDPFILWKNVRWFAYIICKKTNIFFDSFQMPLSEL